MPEIEIRSEIQQNPIADEVSALIAIVRPILTGLLWSLKEDIVTDTDSYESLKLKKLPRLYRQGDGDCGICYEYAVHEAIRSGDAVVASDATAGVFVSANHGSAGICVDAAFDRRSRSSSKRCC